MAHLTPPIPVTFVLEELNFGGTQRQTLELARRLDRSLFVPRFWTLWPGEEMLELAQAADIAVTPLTTDAKLCPAHAIPALWRTLQQKRPPLLHLCTSFPNIWGRLLGKLARVPAIVGSCRGQGNVRGQHEFFLWRLAQAHICNARSIREAFLRLGVPESRVIHIPNGVDTDFFVPSAATEQRGSHVDIVCVGRLVPEKDHATLLRAFALLRESVPQARLHLVGDGPLLPATRALAAELSLGESVVFHGASRDVRGHLQAAQLMVLASTSEGTPNVLLEGMACGLPVVATRVGGIPDLVQHGEQGLLVEAGAPEALEEALRETLTHEDRARRMGQAGRQRVLEHFSLRSMTRQHEAVYLSVCRQTGLTA